MLKTEYLDAFPDFEIAMLQRGYTLCFVSHPTRWAPDSETKVMAEFVKFVAAELGMEPKVIAIGMSCGGLQAARLAELCGRDKADVSRSVAAMEEKGLLIRENKPYRAQLYLTEKGKEAAGAVCRRVTVAVEHAGKGYTVAQRKVFYQVLETVTQNLSELCKDGIPEK